MIHAKSVVVDGLWTLIGSTNLDRLSLGRNAELDIEIHGSTPSQHAVGLFKADRDKSRRLTLAEWRRRPRIRTALTRVAWAARRWQ